MSRLWILAILCGGLAGAPAAVAQEPPAAPKDTKAAPKEQKPAEEQLPPEEDVAATPQQYTFNPVRSKRDVEVGNFYFKKGDWKAAALRFREATLWNEGNSEAWLRLGETEEKRGGVKAAKAAYAKYLELAQDSKLAPDVKKRLERLK